MKHLFNKRFQYLLTVLGSSEIRYGITVCSVLRDFIKDLVNNGFSISDIVTILNFILYELGSDFKIKYYHVYHFVKQNKLKN